MSRKKRKNTRSARLQSAKDWLVGYEGENVVKGYQDRFDVTFHCALEELEMLSVKLDPICVQSMIISEKQRMVAVRKKRQMRRAQRKKESRSSGVVQADSDAEFAFIAGYTSGGVAFGITWEESKEPEAVDFNDSKWERIFT